VKLDLANRPARQHLFSQIRTQSKKVLVLTEGLVPYFSNDDAASLADDLHGAENFSYWLLDYFSSKLIKYMRGGAMRRQMRNAPFLFDPPEYFAFFKEHGWHARETRYLGEESERLGRPIPAPWFFKILRVFMPPEQRTAMKRFSAYVLMERK
jgi:O-methyltransferase involved in polyketide biosynthesis